MKTFEYDILFFQVKKQKDYDAMRSALNERGAEGWEVITAEAGDYGYITFLKRESLATNVASE
ncbi:hypothetical protein G5B38_21125 (plasmid) [Pseudohalocynthiibacter aestuariivivens]|jgi:hypothetical protein|uniref:hypothetical protein n=1 Tax=Rhodobacterales TaxID=204455 RepID=UPI000806AA59|nr:MULTISPECIES: hypothetical protein [Rhodobacterales]QEE37478.1 hypothetical protein FTO60_17065 [Octadecabacter sp. SW4]QIE48109.1 hypothetical protein G5B38_21125 [Pseudohalocynthiibacter aestuariivivens]GLP88209.1 hypothetical protein GCM10007921_37700 [Tritonibacter mobilis]SDY00402.1 hypothetical protein SAMN05444385_12048 [Tritonibacter mobilis]